MKTQRNYADINGLQLYYEIHGEGKPLLLLPGALSGIDTAFGKLIPLLAINRFIDGYDPQIPGKHR